MKIYAMQTTTNKKTGKKTYFINSKKVKHCFFEYIDILADRKDCFLTTNDCNYKRDFYCATIYF